MRALGERTGVWVNRQDAGATVWKLEVGCWKLEVVRVAPSPSRQFPSSLVRGVPLRESWARPQGLKAGRALSFPTISIVGLPAAFVNGFFAWLSSQQSAVSWDTSEPPALLSGADEDPPSYKTTAGRQSAGPGLAGEGTTPLGNTPVCSGGLSFAPTVGALRRVLLLSWFPHRKPLLRALCASVVRSLPLAFLWGFGYSLPTL